MLSSKARLYGNPTPFPNQALLEKLSNKLAQEEAESNSHGNNRAIGTNNSHSGIKLSIGPMFKVDSEGELVAKGKTNAKKSMKYLDSSSNKVKKVKNESQHYKSPESKT